MITVHHLDKSRSQRVLWLLEELGADYEVKRYERDPVSSLAPPELKKIHPLGKSPVIEDDGLIVAETGAIFEYLVEKFGGALMPPRGTPEKLKYTYWLHFAEGTAMSQLLLKLFFSRVKEAKMPFFAKPIAKKVADNVLDGYIDPNIAAMLKYIDDELGKTTWFAGEELTAADVIMSFPMEAMAARGGIDASLINANAFLKRIHDRPAYKRALDTGGPYDILG